MSSSSAVVPRLAGTVSSVGFLRSLARKVCTKPSRGEPGHTVDQPRLIRATATHCTPSPTPLCSPLSQPLHLISSIPPSFFGFLLFLSAVVAFFGSAPPQPSSSSMADSAFGAWLETEHACARRAAAAALVHGMLVAQFHLCVHLRCLGCRLGPGPGRRRGPQRGAAAIAGVEVLPRQQPRQRGKCGVSLRAPPGGRGEHGK